MKRITIRDIAEKSGYSIATVSKALNGTDRVGMDAIIKIRSIAAEMGYQSSLLAQSLAGKIRRVAILLPEEPRNVRKMFEEGFAEDFGLYGELGIEPSYYLYGDAGSIPPIEEIAAQCDGLILMPRTAGPVTIDSLAPIGKSKPLVILQNKFPSQQKLPRLCDVTVDARIVGAMAAQYLGIRRPGGQTAMVIGQPNTWLHSENAKGFLQSAQEYGIQNIAIEESHDNMERAYAMTGQLLDRFPSLQGIFVTSHVSPAVCRCVRDRGRDVSVVGVTLFAEGVCCLQDGSMDAIIFQNQKKQAKLALSAIVSAFRGLPVEAERHVKPELVLRSNLPCYL